MTVVAENPIGGDDQFLHCQTNPCQQKSEYQSDVRKLVNLLSKLNPLAKEFIPSSSIVRKLDGRLSADAPVFIASTDYYNNSSNGNSSKDSSSDGSSNNQQLNWRRRNGYRQGRRVNDRGRKVEKDESIRRTVYVSDIDHNVTEEHLAELFAACGQVVDCRVCGDPHSILRFAFVEFSDEEGARAALNLGGTMLGFYPVRVLPSKTAILPVNPKFLPRSNDEREMVVRTVYCTNIDKKVTQLEVKRFFEQVCCGEVSCLRLLGDNAHSTRIAFVEFVLGMIPQQMRRYRGPLFQWYSVSSHFVHLLPKAESAILALNCSGMVLGSLPIRVSPSKTPVRPRIPRAASR